MTRLRPSPLPRTSAAAVDYCQLHSTAPTCPFPAAAMLGCAWARSGRTGCSLHTARDIHTLLCGWILPQRSDHICMARLAVKPRSASGRRLRRTLLRDMARFGAAPSFVGVSAGRNLAHSPTRSAGRHRRRPATSFSSTASPAGICRGGVYRAGQARRPPWMALLPPTRSTLTGQPRRP